MLPSLKTKLGLLMLATFMFGCAQTEQQPQDDTASQVLTVENKRDPWEGFNRKVFAFNDNFFLHFLVGRVCC